MDVRRKKRDVIIIWWLAVIDRGGTMHKVNVDLFLPWKGFQFFNEHVLQ